MHAATDQQPVTAARTRTVLALVCALAAGPLAAQVKISGLPAATTPLASRWRLSDNISCKVVG